MRVHEAARGSERPHESPRGSKRAEPVTVAAEPVREVTRVNTCQNCLRYGFLHNAQYSRSEIECNNWGEKTCLTLP